MRCLEITVKRKELISRLKRTSKNSIAFQNIKNGLIELKMNQPPHGIHQKHILQNTFQFIKPQECFHKLRLVSASWKNAVETMKFNTYFDRKKIISISRFCDEEYYSKYFKMFKKLNLCINDEILKNWKQIKRTILNNMKNLNEIRINIRAKKPKKYITFVKKILQNSHLTLDIFEFSHLLFFHGNLNYSNITKLVLDIQNHAPVPVAQLHRQLIFEINNPTYIRPCNCLNKKFISHFANIIKKIDYLQLVQLELCMEKEDVHFFQYIADNYQKNCIYGNFIDLDVLNIIPIKILVGVDELKDLENKQYTSELEYLHIDFIGWAPMMGGWDRYQEIF